MLLSPLGAILDGDKKRRSLRRGHSDVLIFCILSLRETGRHLSPILAHACFSLARNHGSESVAAGKTEIQPMANPQQQLETLLSAVHRPWSVMSAKLCDSHPTCCQLRLDIEPSSGFPTSIEQQPGPGPLVRQLVATGTIHVPSSLSGHCLGSRA